MPLRSASSCSHEKQMFSYRVVVYLHVCDPNKIPRYIGGLVFGKHFLLYRSAQPCSATLQISAVIARPSIIPIQESHLGAELGRTSMAMCLGDFFGRIHLGSDTGSGTSRNQHWADLGSPATSALLISKQVPNTRTCGNDAPSTLGFGSITAARTAQRGVRKSQL